MKGRIIGLALAGCVLLTGCEAMLERSYQTVTAHVDKPTTAEDPSVLRVENYRELVSAVLYLVAQGQEEGIIQLHDYAGEVEADLNAACLEVATEDPLGAYAVDYIKHESSRVVSYYQATISIRYRRTVEQVRSMVNVTGSGAIRTELQEALAQFAPEVVLRVAYFAEDEASIQRLIRQAYYDTPLTALGMPRAEVKLYPDSGSQRVVEITLTYPETTDVLRRKSEELSDRVGAASAEAPVGQDLRSTAVQLAARLKGEAAFDREGGQTAYAALVEGSADQQGMALAYALLCQQAGITGEVVEGRRQGESWFWNGVQLSGGERLYVDVVLGDGLLHTAGELAEKGYEWADGPVPEETGRASPGPVDGGGQEKS